ncbi:MAG: hypothetical protein ABIK09_21205, partial [Pseudomonadota bacterium]
TLSVRGVDWAQTLEGLVDQSVIAYRTRMLNARGGWQSSGDTFNAKVLEAANLALIDMATVFPDEILSDVYHQVAMADVTSTDSDVLAAVEATSDPLVLNVTDNAGTSLTLSTVTSWVPTIDGTWDGVMWIEAQDPDGQWHRRQTLEWWLDGARDQYSVTIDRPWRNGTDELMDFRLVQEALWFPGDILGPKVSGRIWDGSHGEVTLIDRADARDLDLRDTRGDTSGEPENIFLGNRRFSLQGPMAAPTVSLHAAIGGGTWAGPWEGGTFRFLYTIVWGRRDAEWQDGMGGTRDPVWESPPSPISTVTGHTAAPFHYFKVRMTNIDQVMGFGVPATYRYSRSGRRLRIYIARDSIVTTGVAGTYLNLETDNIFYYLDEIEPTDVGSLSGDPTTYDWDGSTLPDFSRRFRRSTGYFGWHLYPVPDQRYEIDFDISRYPRELVNDRDVVPVREDAGMVFHWLLLAHMSMVDGNDLASHNEYRDQAMKTHTRLRNRRRAGSGLVTPKHYRGAAGSRVARTGSMGDG